MSRNPRFVARSCEIFRATLAFLSFSILLKSWTNPVGLVVGSKLQLGSIWPSVPGFVSWSLTILSFRESCILQKKSFPEKSTALLCYAINYANVIIFKKRYSPLRHLLSLMCQPVVYWLSKQSILWFVLWLAKFNIWKDFFVNSEYRYISCKPFFTELGNMDFQFRQLWQFATSC